MNLTRTDKVTYKLSTLIWLKIAERSEAKSAKRRYRDLTGHFFSPYSGKKPIAKSFFFKFASLSQFFIKSFASLVKFELLFQASVDNLSV